MRKQSVYISGLITEKQIQLDRLIRKYHAHPVGRGYIDIIVLKHNCIHFINELTTLKLAINSVSWWCHATEENKKTHGCPHGYGGPKTKFGWFSEMSHDCDDMRECEPGLFYKLDNDPLADVIKEINDQAINVIENKQNITYANAVRLNFKQSQCLTPGICVYVPGRWKSIQESSTR